MVQKMNASPAAHSGRARKDARTAACIHACRERQRQRLDVSSTEVRTQSRCISKIDVLRTVTEPLELNLLSFEREKQLTERSP